MAVRKIPALNSSGHLTITRDAFTVRITLYQNDTEVKGYIHPGKLGELFGPKQKAVSSTLCLERFQHGVGPKERYGDCVAVESLSRKTDQVIVNTHELAAAVGLRA